MRRHSWLGMDFKTSPANENYGALFTSASVYSQYDFSQQSSSLTVHMMFDSYADEGIGLTLMTNHTPLQYCNIYWHKFLGHV